jgi:hypothetical protein
VGDTIGGFKNDKWESYAMTGDPSVLTFIYIFINHPPYWSRWMNQQARKNMLLGYFKNAE